MGLFVTPQMLGNPVPIAPSPVGHSLIRALLARHGAAVPASPTAPTAVPPAPVAPPAAAPGPVDAFSPSTAPAAPDLASASSALGPMPTIKKPGMLDRVNDFLKSDEGRADMMRFAAGALNGGLGGGLTAATNYADERTKEADARALDNARMALAMRNAQDTYNLGLGRLGIEADNAGETARHNRSTEATANAGLGVRQWEHITPSGDTVANNRERQFEHTTQSADSAATQAGENYRHGTQSADNLATNATNVAIAGMPARPQAPMTETTTTTDAVPASSGFFGLGGSAGSPKTSVTVRAPAAPSQVRPNTGADEVRYDGQGLAYTKGPDGTAVRAPQYDRR